MKSSTLSLETNSLAASVSNAYTYYPNKNQSIQYKWLKNRDFKDSASTNDSFFKLSSATSEFHSQKYGPEVELKSKKVAAYLVSLIRKDEYIAGETSKSELYLEKLYYEDKLVFREAFQKTWLELFKDDDESFATFLNVASSIEYSWLGDRADALVIAGCSHLSPIVNEAAIRVIEAWSNPGHVDYLNKVKPFTISWLESYRQSVLDYLVGL